MYLYYAVSCSFYKRCNLANTTEQASIHTIGDAKIDPILFSSPISYFCIFSPFFSFSLSGCHMIANQSRTTRNDEYQFINVFSVLFGEHIFSFVYLLFANLGRNLWSKCCIEHILYSLLTDANIVLAEEQLFETEVTFS